MTDNHVGAAIHDKADDGYDEYDDHDCVDGDRKSDGEDSSDGENNSDGDTKRGDGCNEYDDGDGYSIVTIAALVATTHSGISHHGKSPECQSDSSLCK